MSTQEAQAQAHADALSRTLGEASETTRTVSEKVVAIESMVTAAQTSYNQEMRALQEFAHRNREEIVAQAKLGSDNLGRFVEQVRAEFSAMGPSTNTTQSGKQVTSKSQRNYSW